MPHSGLGQFCYEMSWSLRANPRNWELQLGIVAGGETSTGEGAGPAVRGQSETHALVMSFGSSLVGCYFWFCAVISLFCAQTFI